MKIIYHDCTDGCITEVVFAQTSEYFEFTIDAFNTKAGEEKDTYDEFVEYHKKVYDILKIQTVSVEMGEIVDNGDSKSYNYTANFKSSEYGQFIYDMHFEVYKKTKFYLVAWTPSNVVPEMQKNDKIYSSSLKLQVNPPYISGATLSGCPSISLEI